MSNPDESMLLPFFGDKPTSEVIRHQQNVAERISWARYFDKYGCLRCGERNAIHAGCGCCQACYTLILHRKKRIIRDEIGERDEGREHVVLVHPPEKRTFPPRPKKIKPAKPPRLFRSVNVNRICWCISFRDPQTGKVRTKWLGNVKKVTREQAEAKMHAWLRALERSRTVPAEVSPSREAERPAEDILDVLAQTQARTAATVEQPPTAPPPQPVSVKKPRVKPTVKLVRVRRAEGAGKYWRIIFSHDGRPRCKWFGSEDAVTQEQAQALADAWLLEHYPEFFPT